MDTSVISVVGTVGTLLSTASLLPQVLHTWRTRSAADISATWLGIAIVSMLVWICYGGLVSAYALVWANALTLVQAAVILFVKLRHNQPQTIEP